MKPVRSIIRNRYIFVCRNRNKGHSLHLKLAVDRFKCVLCVSFVCKIYYFFNSLRLKIKNTGLYNF